MKDLSLMPTLNSQLVKLNMTTHLRAIQEAVLSLVDSKLMLNYLMKLLGLLRKILILTSLEVNIEIDIISLSHSTNQVCMILTEE